MLALVLRWLVHPSRDEMLGFGVALVSASVQGRDAGFDLVGKCIRPGTRCWALVLLGLMQPSRDEMRVFDVVCGKCIRPGDEMLGVGVRMDEVELILVTVAM